MTRRQALGAIGALALPFPSPGRSAPGPPLEAFPPGQAGPDLGNLFPVVEWIAREHTPSHSFLDPRWSSLEAWKASARPAFHRHLSFDPTPLPVQGEVTAREERAGLTIESIRMRATPAYEIPARLLLPSRRQGRLPAVIALHCHGGEYRWGLEKLVSGPDDPPALVEYRDRLYGRPYAEALARRGFVVLVSDAFYFGERRLRVESLDPATVPAEAREHFRALATLAEGTPQWLAAANRVAGAYETVVAKTLLAAGASWPGLLVWDDRRSLDYLAGRPEVDPGRIGCVGLSLGGLRAARLVAADPRLRAACVVAWMTEFGQLLAQHVRRHTWMAYLPGVYRSLDLPDEAALLAPGALLVQQCARDTLFPMSGMRGAVEKLHRIYARAGIPERFRGSFHDQPHSFPPLMQEEAFAWLERWL